MSVKSKGKIHSTTDHAGPEAEQRYSSTVSLTWGGWLTPRPDRLTPRKKTRYSLYRGAWRSGRVQNIFPSPGFDPRIVQPIASRYTDPFFCSFYFNCTSLSWLSWLCLLSFTLQHTTQTSMPLAGFKPAIPASDRPQNLALDLSATVIGLSYPGPPTARMPSFDVTKWYTLSPQCVYVFRTNSTEW